MDYTWTEVQKRRLAELNASSTNYSCSFSNVTERETAFKKLQQQLSFAVKDKLQHFRQQKRRSTLNILEEELAAVLRTEGFVQVNTPTILSKQMLAKMTIDDTHALYSQVFWLDERKCLRPMLAPNLYYLLKDLLRLWTPPVRIFEIGSCFRKESQGNNHLNEFTMLNLVEWGLPAATCQERLAELASVVMNAAGIAGWSLAAESSVVYGDTVDVVLADLELGSGAMGPHVLDGNWGMSGPWVGIGFGLERLAMVKDGEKNVRSTGRSLSYLDGARLNV